MIRAARGTLAHITECVDEGDGRYSLRAVIGGRIRVRDWFPDDPYPVRPSTSGPTSRDLRWVPRRSDTWSI